VNRHQLHHSNTTIAAVTTASGHTTTIAAPPHVFEDYALWEAKAIAAAVQEEMASQKRKTSSLVMPAVSLSGTNANLLKTDNELFVSSSAINNLNHNINFSGFESDYSMGGSSIASLSRSNSTKRKKRTNNNSKLDGTADEGSKKGGASNADNGLGEFIGNVVNGGSFEAKYKLMHRIFRSLPKGEPLCHGKFISLFKQLCPCSPSFVVCRDPLEPGFVHRH
jgi:hypothetical protein